MKINKTKLIIGILSLLLAAIATACFMYRFQKDSIDLLAVLIFSIIYSKGFRDEELIRFARSKIPAMVFTFVGFVNVIAGLILMPNTVGSLIPPSYQGLAYGVSFILWVMGMVCLDYRYGTIEE